jgi:organic radical activating enzyme
MLYPVTEIFDSIQGEGHFVGYPMSFVRLAGCSVQECAIREECDEAPWKMRERLSARDIAARATRQIVCLTGGEPTDHDLLPLIAELRSRSRRVHLETSGERLLEGIPIDWMTVSPKTRGYRQRSGHTLKVVLRPGWGWREIEELDEGTAFFHRYLQPLTLPDGSSNLDEVIALVNGAMNGDARWALSVQAHRGWRLS